MLPEQCAPGLRRKPPLPPHARVAVRAAGVESGLEALPLAASIGEEGHFLVGTHEGWVLQDSGHGRPVRVHVMCA